MGESTNAMHTQALFYAMFYAQTRPEDPGMAIEILNSARIYEKVHQLSREMVERNTEAAKREAAENHFLDTKPGETVEAYVFRHVLNIQTCTEF